MSRTALVKLVGILTSSLKSDDKMARVSSGGPICLQTKVAIGLRMLAGANYNDLRVGYKIHKSTIYQIFHRVVRAINRNFKITFPLNDESALRDISNGFIGSRMQGSPLSGCVGALDGIGIKIRRPWRKEVVNRQGFWSRKGFYAINVQALCDSNYRFLYVSYRCAGSTHDSTAWSVTALHDAISNGHLAESFWIAADDAYACTEQTLTPWPGEVTLYKDSFNFHLSSLRIHIEQAFGMLVRRWGILWKPMQVTLSNSKEIFMACVKLHNYCLDEKELDIRMLDDDSIEEVNRDFNSWWIRANQNFRHLQRGQGSRRDLEKSKKRTELTRYLMSQRITRPSTF